MSAGSNGAWAGAGQAIARIGEMGMQSNLEDFRQQRLNELRQQEKTEDRAYAAEGKQDDRNYAKGLLDEQIKRGDASASAKMAHETEQDRLDRESKEKVAGIKAGKKNDPDRSLLNKDKFVFEQYKDQYLELNKDYNDRVEMNEKFAETPRGIEMKKDMQDLRGKLDTYFSAEIKDVGMKGGVPDAKEKPVNTASGLLDTSYQQQKQAGNANSENAGSAQEIKEIPKGKMSSAVVNQAPEKETPKGNRATGTNKPPEITKIIANDSMYMPANKKDAKMAMQQIENSINEPNIGADMKRKLIAAKLRIKNKYGI